MSKHLHTEFIYSSLFAAPHDPLWGALPPRRKHYWEEGCNALRRRKKIAVPDEVALYNLFKLPEDEPWEQVNPYVEKHQWKEFLDKLEAEGLVDTSFKLEGFSGESLYARTGDNKFGPWAKMPLNLRSEYNRLAGRHNKLAENYFYHKGESEND